jgi:hypothetical protein
MEGVKILLRQNSPSEVFVDEVLKIHIYEHLSFTENPLYNPIMLKEYTFLPKALNDRKKDLYWCPYAGICLSMCFLTE